MKLQQRHRRSKTSDNNLIPLINVVFLMLIFFMVAGNIRLSDPLALAAPESTGDKPIVAQTVLYVARDGTLMLNNTQVSMNTLQTTLERLSVMPVTDNTSPDNASLETRKKTLIIPHQELQLAIKADAQATVALLREVMSVIREAGLSRVELLTTWIPPASR